MKLSSSQKRKKLRQLIAINETLIAPGIYDGYGARLVQDAGFLAAYMTGNGVSACLLGTPDIGQIDLTIISDHARRVASCVDIPLICDADNCYGGILNIKRTVEEFEASGVAAIHIEDQIFPKRCAQFPGARTVLNFDQALANIQCAIAARSDKDFMIIARTDSASAFGLDEAIHRAKAFTEAGADAVFIELKANPDCLKYIKRIKEEVPNYCLYNVDVGGPISLLKASELKNAGVDIAIHPTLARGVFGFAMENALKHLQNQKTLENYQDHMFTGNQYNRVLGIENIEAWEKKFTP